MNTIAGVIVGLSGIWLIGLAAVAVAKPDLLKRFFDGFASSAQTHFFEMFLRAFVGTAFIIYSAQTKFPNVFTAFGFLLLLTTAVLVFVPWKIHRRFAERSLPMVNRHPLLFALVSFAGGTFIFISLIVE